MDKLYFDTQNILNHLSIFSWLCRKIFMNINHLEHSFTGNRSREAIGKYYRGWSIMGLYMTIMINEH